MVKNPPAMQEMWVQSLGQEDPLEEMATHSSILAWRIPGTEEPGGLQSTGSQRIEHDWATNTFTFPRDDCGCYQVVALEVEGKVEFWIYFEGRAKRISWQNECRAYGVKHDSRCLGELPSSLMGKVFSQHLSSISVCSVCASGGLAPSVLSLMYLRAGT